MGNAKSADEHPAGGATPGPSAAAPWPSADRPSPNPLQHMQQQEIEERHRRASAAAEAARKGGGASGGAGGAAYGPGASPVCRATVKRIVDGFMANNAINSPFVPDFVERAIYENVMTLALGLVDEVLAGARIEVLGHRMELRLSAAETLLHEGAVRCPGPRG